MIRRTKTVLNNSLGHLKGTLFAFLALILVFGFASQALAVSIPAGGAIKPDGTRLYVPDQANGHIYIYDINPTTGAIGSILRDINAFGYPYGMVISPDGNWLYASIDGTAGMVRVYDIGSGDPSSSSAVVSLGTTATPKGIAITPDGNTLYVADGGRQMIHIVDVSTPTSPVRTGDITTGSGGSPLPSFLYGVAVKPDGSRLYVSHRSTTGHIYAYDITGASPVFVKEQSHANLMSPSYIVIPPDGDRLMVRVSRLTSPYTDVMILDTTDNLNVLSSTALDTNNVDPGNSHGAESLSIRPDGYVFYATHYLASNNGVHTYGLATTDPSNNWEVWSYDTSRDFSVVSPNGQYIYLTYSNGGTAVVHETDPTNSNDIPGAPVITYPLKDYTNVAGSVQWTAAQDDGGSANLVYRVEVILAANIATNNWTIMADTGAGATSAPFTGMTAGEWYYVRVRAWDGEFVGPWAYSGPFQMGSGAGGPIIDHFEDTGATVITEAFVYDTVNIIGTGFGADPGNGNRDTASENVTIAGLVIPDENPDVGIEVYYWSDTAITIGIPQDIGGADIVGGPNAIVVTAGSQASNSVNLTVRPRIWSLTPNTGPIGTTVTIDGNAYGSSSVGNTVTFNGTPATAITSWTNTQIVVDVPVGYLLLDLFPGRLLLVSRTPALL
jgi:DNA-binding beta-propeller fold protein YncE